MSQQSATKGALTFTFCTYASFKLELWQYPAVCARPPSSLSLFRGAQVHTSWLLQHNRAIIMLSGSREERRERLVVGGALLALGIAVAQAVPPIKAVLVCILVSWRRPSGRMVALRIVHWRPPRCLGALSGVLCP